VVNRLRVRRVITVLAAVVAANVVVVPGTSSGAGNRVKLRFFRSDGSEYSAAEARSVIECRSPTCTTTGKSGWTNDALVDPQTLRARKVHSLTAVGGFLGFNRPAGAPVALAIDWPTSTRGYSLLVIDNAGAGFVGATTVNVTYQGARDAQRRLDAMLAARPDYARSPVFASAYDAASAHIALAASTTDESTRGAQGQLALDQLAVATDALLAEYGVSYARAHPPVGGPWLGVTVDRIAGSPGTLDQAAAIAAPYGWVRIVFDPQTPPSYYASVVAEAKSRGLKILGEPIDSSDAKHYTVSTYLARFRQYVQAFPQIDAWEVGNEVNGSWLGRNIADKVAATAEWVDANSNALVVLTFFWELGGGSRAHAVFNWIDAKVPASVRSHLDVVALSTYVEDDPLGLGFDQVYRTLHDEFPDQQIAVGELDYWSAGTTQVWWAMSPNDPTGAARRAVARQYYRAALGYDRSVGGCFWWYFATEMQPPSGSALAAVVADLRDELSA